MDEKSLVHVYEADVMALPPLRLVLGEVPSPDPDLQRDSQYRLRRLPAAQRLEMAVTVRRLINHLEKKQ